MKYIKLFENFEAINEGKIVFSSLSQKNLWDEEITGQLSDGYWENSRPSDHWEAWANATSSVGSKTGIDFVSRRSNYNLTNRELLDIVGGRMLIYGAAGVAGFDITKNPWISSLEYLVTNADSPEEMASTITGTPFDTALEQYETSSKIINKFWQDAGAAIRANYSKAKKVWETIAKGKYTTKNLKDDLTAINSTMKKSI
jgi:hypothetical protein